MRFLYLFLSIQQIATCQTLRFGAPQYQLCNSEAGQSANSNARTRLNAPPLSTFLQIAILAFHIMIYRQQLELLLDFLVAVRLIKILG